MPSDVAIEQCADGIEVPDRGSLKAKARRLNVRFHHPSDSRTVVTTSTKNTPSQPAIGHEGLVEAHAHGEMMIALPGGHARAGEWNATRWKAVVRIGDVRPLRLGSRAAAG
jgi:hypothetical protein